MKKLAMVFILCWSAAAGAVPSTINFTGRLSTSAGPVTGAVNLTLKLYNVATDGTPLWTEIHNNVGAEDGLVFLDVGSLKKLDETVFNGDRLYLEIVVGTETLAPRLAINSVPYAMRTAAATTADLLGTIAPRDVVTSVTAAAGIAAVRNGNGVAVSMSTTGCAAGSAWTWSGTAWACAALPVSGACTWAAASSTAVTVSAACPTGKHAVTGGCDAGTGGTLVSSHPSGSTAPPANGALGSTVTQWSCQFGSTTTTHAAYALCCAQ
ncbi:MAG TPA: hypothetical protein VHT91_31500 [Kofleriaceae bacterium]|nr:hypothetical protein [Kofleriaceae bacterium]